MKKENKKVEKMGTQPNRKKNPPKKPVKPKK